MNKDNNAGKAMKSTMQRQKFRGKNNPVQAKMTHTHERIYPIHIGTKVFLKYNSTFTLHCPKAELPRVGFFSHSISFPGNFF